MNDQIRRPLKLMLLGAVAACAVSPALAQTGSTADSTLDQVVVTGTRFAGRTVTSSPVPIDSISASELRGGGYSELHQALKAIAPSFSMPHPSTAATLDFTSAPSLRGLSPGQVLVLINGKRRHNTGDLGTGVQIGRGDVAYDFNAIPVAALGRVEVLRDGATAQYGADAIAGVINVVLDRTTGVGGDLMYGATKAGDGQQVNANAYLGVNLADRGVLRATVAFQDHNKTDRSNDDTRQQYFGGPAASRTISGNFGSGNGLTPANGTLDPREATVDRHDFRYGDSPYRSRAIFLNGDYDLNDKVTAYAFGGYSKLTGTSYGFFRRAGQDETVRALFPNGYLPRVEVEMTNASMALGFRGKDLAGFGWDLSSVYGGAVIDFTQANSNNPSMGAGSPTRSYRGGSRFRQWTSNLDITREIATGDADPLKIALGVEHREEYYKLTVGDLASYLNGGVAILDGPNVGRPAPVGFQVTSGNRPSDAVDVTRAANSGYAELEKRFFGRLTLTGSARWEDYSDFGSNTTYKLAGRFQVAGPLAIRGSLGSGLRAPNLAQSYFSNTSVIFLNGNPVVNRILPVSDPAARALGSSPLKPEKSDNASVGAVFSWGGLDVSVDAYRIKIDDRIALSSTFQDQRVTDQLAATGNPGIGAASYLTNAVDTTTRGVDVTARYRHNFGEMGTGTATVAANFNKTKFDRIAPTPAPLLNLGIRTPLFDLTQQVRFTDASPRNKVVVGLNWEWKKFSLMLNNIRYGEVSAVAFANLTPAQIAAVTPGYKVRLAPTDPVSGNSQVIQVFQAKTITDLELTFHPTRKIDLSIGANNLFNVYPTKNLPSTPASVAAGTNGSDNAGIFPYNYISPFGWNGRFVYAKAAYRF